MPTYHHVRWLVLRVLRHDPLGGAQVQAAGNPGVPARLCRVYGQKLRGPVGAKWITKGFNLTLMIQLHRPLQPPPSNSSLASPLIAYLTAPAGASPPQRYWEIAFHFPAEAHHSPRHPLATKRHDSAQQCLVLLAFLGLHDWLRPLRRTPWARQTGLARSPIVPAMLSPPSKLFPVAPSAISPCGNYFPRPSHICLRAYLLRLLSLLASRANRHRVAVVPLFRPTHTHSRVKIQSSSHPHSLQLSASVYSELVELISLKLRSFSLLGSV